MSWKSIHVMYYFHKYCIISFIQQITYYRSMMCQELFMCQDLFLCQEIFSSCWCSNCFIHLERCGPGNTTTSQFSISPGHWASSGSPYRSSTLPWEGITPCWSTSSALLALVPCCQTWLVRAFQSLLRVFRVHVFLNLHLTRFTWSAMPHKVLLWFAKCLGFPFGEMPWACLVISEQVCSRDKEKR
jgi:hypothetical protein